MTTANVKTGVWTIENTYLKINAGVWTYSADDTPAPSGPQAGTLWAWGKSSDGALGDSTAIPKSSPVQIPGTQWVEMSTGCKHNIARKSDCTIWTWGNNGYGQTGVGDTSQRSSPIQVPGTSWTCVSAGENSNFALKSDNTLWAWGSNRYGRLGTNSYGYSPKSSPFQIPGTNWVSVSSSAGGVAFADSIVTGKQIGRASCRERV